MRAALFLLVLALGIVGCTTAPPQPAKPMSPYLAFHAADLGYQQVLTQVVAYRDQCINTPEHLRGNCYQVVQIMRRVNREAQDVRELGELAAKDGNEGLLKEAAERLDELRDQLRADLISKIEKDQAAAAPEGAIQ